jgi:hypothetical protein
VPAGLLGQPEPPVSAGRQLGHDRKPVHPYAQRDAHGRAHVHAADVRWVGGWVGGSVGRSRAVVSGLQCPVQVTANANWPLTNSGDVVYGNCTPGFADTAGLITRACLITGVWNDTIINTCYRTCAVRRRGAGGGGALPLTQMRVCVCVCASVSAHVHSELYCNTTTEGGAVWSQTQAGTTVTSTCAVGLQGAPFRDCGLDGLWKTIQAPCARTCTAPWAWELKQRLTTRCGWVAARTNSGVVSRTDLGQRAMARHAGRRGNGHGHLCQRLWPGCRGADTHMLGGWQLERGGQPVRPYVPVGCPCPT